MSKVLYVEDDSLLREVTTIALESAGFEVTQAHDGAAAQALLAAHRDFDFLVTDISMPGGVSGIEVARSAREAQPSCRTVLVSGYARAQLPDLPENVRFLGKPYLVRDLLDALAVPGGSDGGP